MSAAQAPPAAPDSLMGSNGEPHRIGRYTLSREIGKGSFAVVFKGWYPASPPSTPVVEDGKGALASTPSSSSTPRTTVAIKVVTRRKLTAKLMENLEGEISILKAIKHPNVVELIDCLKTDSHIYLVMAFCSAGDLSLYIRKKGILAGGEKESIIYDAGAARLDGPHGAMGASGLEMYPHPEEGGLNLDVARCFLSQLAAALEFMRDRNIVHRDIKPQNLLLSPPDMACLAAGHPRGIHQLKVADFGFARNLPAASLAETLCGSPLYMAPEILRYEKYDAKADLWSVGAVLYEMVVGKPPFRASNHVELARKIERGEDRIRFPDERSPASLAREKERREELGERDVEIKRPQVVADDIKALIRTLLKRKPVERLSFDEFFRSPVIEGVRQGNRERAARIRKVQEEAEARKLAEAQARQAQEAAAAAAAMANKANAAMGASRTAPIASATPAPPFARTQPVLLRSKYVVSRSTSGAASRQAPGPAAEDHPPPPVGSGFHPRRPSSLSETPPLYNPAEPSSLEDNVPQTPGASVTDLVSGGGGGDATSGRGGAGDVVVESVTVTPGGKGGDSSGQGSEELLGKEYVMVEKRNVEVNALADQLAASPSAQRRFSGHSAAATGAKADGQGAVPGLGSLGRRPSRLSRFGSGLSVAAAAAWNANAGVTSRGATSTSPSSDVGPTSTVSPDGSLGGTTATAGTPRPGTTPPSSAPFALPPGARRSSFHRRLSSSNSGSNSPGTRLCMVQRPSPASGVPASEDNQDEGTPQQQSQQQQQQLMTNGHKRAVPLPVPSGKAGWPGASPSLGTSSLPAAFSTSVGSSSLATAGGAGGYVPGGTTGSASGPSSALARAISMASVRLFGVPSGMSLRGAAALVRGHGSRRAALLRSGEYADGAEAGLVATLEDLGQKAFVLSEFADSKLAAFFPTGPHQAGSVEGESPSEANLGSAGGAFSGYGSLSRSASTGGAHRPGLRRGSSSNSSGASGSPGTQNGASPSAGAPSPTVSPSEAAAAEALVLYVKSLSFLQRGIETTKLFIETRSARPSSSYSSSSSGVGGGAAQTNTSPELNEAVQLLRARFNEGYDKADFARARCAEFPESARDVEKLIFDKALEIARSAALDELENNREGAPWSAGRCLLAYETASTMLMALLDPGEESAELDEGAVATVEKFVKSINKRLAALQRRVVEGSPTDAA